MEFSCDARSTVIISGMQTAQFLTGSADERNTEWPNKITALDAAMPILLHIEHPWRGASEFLR
jgi:hypothetical protein